MAREIQVIEGRAARRANLAKLHFQEIAFKVFPTNYKIVCLQKDFFM
jgi:hypothetical protein